MCIRDRSSALAWSGDLHISSASIPLQGCAPLLHDLPWNGCVQVDLTGSGTIGTPNVHGHSQLTGVHAGELDLDNALVSCGLDGRHLTFAMAGLRALSLNGSMTLAGTLPTRLHHSICGPDLGYWLDGSLQPHEVAFKAIYWVWSMWTVCCRGGTAFTTHHADR